jgi:O-antigen ligase
MLTTTIERSALNKLMWVFIAVAGAVFAGHFASSMKLPFLAVTVVFFITLSISFIRGTDGLYLIIFAMLFSPEIGAGGAMSTKAGEGSGIVVRLEDIIMFAVVLGWILRSAYQGKHASIVRTDITPAIWTYMAASVICTLLGILNNTIRFPASAMFHNLKYFEYFLLFFMILAHVRKPETIRNMIIAMLIVFFIALIYGYTQIGKIGRVVAPFDEEPNTFGGYIVLLMCIVGGIALSDNRARVRASMVSLLLFSAPPLLFTLSRASYLGFILGFMAFLVLSQHRILILAIATVLITAMMLGLPLMPERVNERVARTFERETEIHVKVAGIDFDASASARIVSYEQALKLWIKRPVLGYGVTGIHFVDGQYVRLLAETGIAGFSTFMLILGRLLLSVKRIYNNTKDPFLKGTAMGLFCGTIALMGHAFSANTFIIVRISEPFWLLAGLVLLIPKLEQAAELIPSGDIDPHKKSLLV